MLKFPEFSRAGNLLFIRLLWQKVIVITIFKGHSIQTPAYRSLPHSDYVRSARDFHFQSKIVVLHEKGLNYEQKIFCLLQFVLILHTIPWGFPEFSILSLIIPGL